MTARTHLEGLTFARSALSHATCGLDAEHPPTPGMSQAVLRATTCQYEPMS